MIIILSEFVIGSLIILFMVTQIIIPFIRGTVFFPLFSKEAVLHKEIEEVKQEVVEADMMEEIVVLKKAVQEKLEQISTDVEKKRKSNKRA